MTIAFGSIAHIVWICSVRRFNAVSVERFLLAPICVSGQVVIYSSSTSNIVEFDMPAYPGLYLSFLIYYPKL